MDKLNKGDVLQYTGTAFNPKSGKWYTDLTIGKEYVVKHVKGVILLVGEEAKGVTHNRDEMVIIDDVGDEVTLSHERLESFEIVKRGCSIEQIDDNVFFTFTIDAESIPNIRFGHDDEKLHYSLANHSYNSIPFQVFINGNEFRPTTRQVHVMKQANGLIKVVVSYFDYDKNDFEFINANVSMLNFI